MRSVSFSDGGSRDRDIKFQLSRMYLVFCFLGCVVKFPQFPARELEKLTAGGEARTRILAIEFVCFFSLSFFLLFLKLLPTHDQIKRTRSHKQEGANGVNCLTYKGLFSLLQAYKLQNIY